MKYFQSEIKIVREGDHIELNRLNYKENQSFIEDKNNEYTKDIEKTINEIEEVANNVET